MTDTPKVARWLPTEGSLLERSSVGWFVSYEDYQRDLAAANAERDQARQTAEYWKAEHLAGNALLDAANARVEELGRYIKEVKRDIAASVVKSQELEAENSKLRSALEIVHFKQEPWQ